MSDKCNLFGEIKSRKLIISNKEVLDQWLQQAKDGKVAIKIVSEENFHSVRQLRLLYKIFREMAKASGASVEDMKLLIKYEMGFCHSTKVNNKDITICKSISDLSKTEISQFIEFGDIYASQNLGLNILTGDDKIFLKQD